MNPLLKKLASSKLALMGAGGHAKVVLSTLLELTEKNNIHLFDENSDKAGSVVATFVIQSINELNTEKYFHVAVGNNKHRQRIHFDCLERGLQPLSIIDVNSIVAANAAVSEGCYVAAGAIVSAEAKIGQGVIANHSAIVEHDTQVGNFCHVAPGSKLLGGASLGERVFLGSGAVVLPGIHVADDVTVGAGAVVTQDVTTCGAVVVGVPARQQ